MKRYVATVTFYTYGENPQEAFTNAELITNSIAKDNDNHASIEQFHEQKFGTLGSTKIDINKLTKIGDLEASEIF